MPFDFKPQHDFDLHIALEVAEPVLAAMLAKGKAAGIETRGIVDHGFIHSIYFRDPSGHRLELAANTSTPAMDKALDEVKWDMLNEWDRTKKAPAHARWMHDGSGKVK